jgi:hypothetical protein
VKDLDCGRASRRWEHHFIVRADEKLTAFAELESALRGRNGCARQGGEILATLNARSV